MVLYQQQNDKNACAFHARTTATLNTSPLFPRTGFMPCPAGCMAHVVGVVFHFWNWFCTNTLSAPQHLWKRFARFKACAACLFLPNIARRYLPFSGSLLKQANNFGASLCCNNLRVPPCDEGRAGDAKKGVLRTYGFERPSSPSRLPVLYIPMPCA